MNREEIRQAFEELNPSEEQEKRMLNRIRAGKKQKKRSAWRYVLAVLAVIVVLSVSQVGINAATKGQYFLTLQEWMGISPESEEIVKQAQTLDAKGIETYAPDLLYVDEELLVFGNLRGLLVYDSTVDEILGTVDLQAIGCIYFDSDARETCVVKDNDTLVIFNAENGSPYGSYYVYAIAKQEDLALAPEKTGSDEAALEQYYALWQSGQADLEDTFDRFCDMAETEAIFSNDEKYETVMYSCMSRRWSDAGGSEYLSFLVLAQGSYTLYTYDESLQTFAIRPLQLQIDGEGDAQTAEENLPEFVYDGDDEAIGAICAYQQEQKRDSLDDGEVWIPAYVIFKEVEKDGELLVFGNFWSFGYLQTGTLLESTGGGEYPACFHLRESGDGYEVVSVDSAGDGAKYAEDIKSFTKGYPGLYRKYMNHEGNEKEREKARKTYLQMYVQGSGLNIRYYKDFGWDAQELL